MGIATLLVLFRHGDAFKWPAITMPYFDLLMKEGNVGVDIFLFLSAIGLYFSMRKKQSILAFYQRRFSRIIPSYLIIAAPLYAILIFALGSKSIHEYFITLTSIAFWLPEQKPGIESWYVAFIIPLYILYPLVYHGITCSPTKKHTGLIILLALSILIELLMGICCRDYYLQTEIAICRIPIFLLGCICANSVYENKTLNHPLLIASISAILFLAIRVFNLICIDRQSLIFSSIIRKSKILSAIAIILFSCMFFSYITARRRQEASKLLKVLNFFGQHSFEIYIAHTLLIFTYTRLAVYDSFSQFWLYYLAIVPLSVVLAVLARRLASTLISLRPRRGGRSA